jgi:large subunit ribosomal protein L24
MKLKTGDNVIVIAGKDKGKLGRILRVETKTERVVIEGINLVKKHVKPNPNANQPGGIIQRESSIHVSNVAIYNPATKKADRVGFKLLNDGKKVRCYKSNNEVIDVR